MPNREFIQADTLFTVTAPLAPGDRVVGSIRDGAVGPAPAQPAAAPAAGHWPTHPAAPTAPKSAASPASVSDLPYVLVFLASVAGAAWLLYQRAG